jgi:polysaccharide pyruvyl transferase WcaK-like protein
MLELRPGLLTNKGGELMLRAAVAELGADHRLAAEHWIGPYDLRARLGLHQKLWFPRAGRLAGVPARAMPRRFRTMFGLVTEREIDAVVDLAGFAYSDQFGRARAAAAARNARRWKGQGKRLILLPQAFGPFDDPGVREATRSLLAAADLVFIRDGVSDQHVRSLRVPGLNARRAPDFTVALRGKRPADGDMVRYACIVPNQKLLTHTAPGIAASYLDFLTSAVDELRRQAIEPVILLHESSDRELANCIQARTGPLRVVDDPDPLVLKGVLATAHLVVGSRFHALVGALSEGVPAIAAGWSHKYGALFEEYGCEDLVVSPTQDRLRPMIRRLIDGPGRDDLVARLRQRAEEQRRQVAAMWETVRQMIAA